MSLRNIICLGKAKGMGVDDLFIMVSPREMKINILLKKMSAPKKLLGQTIMGKKNIWFIQFCVKQVLGPNKFWVQTKFGSKQIVGPTFCQVQTYFWSKRMLGPKNVESKTMMGPTKIESNRF